MIAPSALPDDVEVETAIERLSAEPRYGDEFVQLLVDEISERPRSLSRTADVVRSGVIARLESAGLAGGHARPLSSEVWSLEVPKDWFKD